MGSSGGGSAQRQAEQQERERQARIDQTTGQINAMFDSPDRQRQITDFQSAMQDFYTQDLNRQKNTADRDLTFALARSGLTGGSRQIDANRTLGEDYQRGILDADRRAQGAAADLRGQDEQTRMHLTSLAQQGLSATNAASQASAAMRSSLEGANASARVQGLGEMFGSVADIKSRSERAAEERRAERAFSNLYGPFWSFGGFSGGRS